MTIGYGFAKVSKVEKERWRQVIDGYLLVRDLSVLKRAYILVDSRHGIKEQDINMMLRLDKAAIPYQIILTKCDVADKEEKRKSLESVFEQVMARRQSSIFPYVLLVSAKTGEGLDSLRRNIIQNAFPTEEADEANDQLNAVEENESFGEIDVDSDPELEISAHQARILRALRLNAEEDMIYDEGSDAMKPKHYLGRDNRKKL